MPKPDALDGAVARGLGFLAKAQEPDGSFISYSSARMRPFRRARSWQTVFVPALMLGALAGLEDGPARDIRDKLAGFLLREKSGGWSFNYWARKSPDYHDQPYPDDLDDTFCALAGLYLHDPALVDEEALAKVIKLLLATETAVGGPYRTWLVPADSEPAWLDVDMAVNSNVAYFLSMVSNGLPNLDRMMGEAIKLDAFVSPYYPTDHPFIYYFARAYRGPHKDLLLKKARKLQRSALTDLDRALALSARLRLGGDRGLQAAADGLMAGQRRDGSWEAAAFYADPEIDGKTYYNGGPALTTAFVLEALGLYRGYIETSAAGRRVRRPATETVLSMAGKRSAGLEEELRAPLMRSLKDLAASGNGEDIISLARRFNASLIAPLPATAANGKLLDTLGLANLWGWLAYTIYDGFLDGEGEPHLLPAANAAARRSLDTFLECMPEDRAFGALVRRTFDAMDGANAWEQAGCRFAVRSDSIYIGRLPDYGDMSVLAGRSLGHALPVMAVLAAAGHDVDGAPARHMLAALKRYLIVRQLNDDAHDWAEDLVRGHVTPVVAAVLSDLQLSGDRRTAELMPTARRRFWRHTLPKVCRQMEGHIASGRSELHKSGLLKPDNVVERLFDGLEESIKDTLARQGEAEAFLRHYARATEGAGI
ncbi:MAG TPA: prenyltransferase/squalene oxidase repeat-containing protein [Candidatus Saccharimonadales bacterium]|nr:prenyltransferase/squalene oxidase repeat-containing protein [Candidatus Saccharimonadales bacterium]